MPRVSPDGTAAKVANESLQSEVNGCTIRDAAFYRATYDAVTAVEIPDKFRAKGIRR